MSGWLRPEGPESVATYWSRRIVVIAAAVVVLVLAIVLVSTAAQGTEPGTAGPSAAPTTSAPAPSGTAAAGASTSTVQTSTPTASGRPSPTSTAPSPASPTGAAGSSTSTPPSTRPSAGTTAPATPACDPTRLRTTLQGDASPKAGQRVAFSLSVINGNPAACVLRRTPASVELKIYSGTDRIWSTADCTRLVPASSQVLKPEQAVAWRLAWDGRRSAAGCTTRPEVPQAGTYFATFQLAGAKPVQQRMLLSAP